MTKLSRFQMTLGCEFGWIELNPTGDGWQWRAKSCAGTVFAEGTARSYDHAILWSNFASREYWKVMDSELVALRAKMADLEKQVKEYEKAERLHKIIRHMKARDEAAFSKVVPPGTVQRRMKEKQQERMEDRLRTAKSEYVQKADEATIIMPGEDGGFEAVRQERDIDERVDAAIEESNQRVFAKVSSQMKARKEQTPREAAERKTHHGYLTSGGIGTT